MKPDRLVFLLALVSIAGCQQQMSDQPSYRPLVPSESFPKGMSARVLPQGVVAREWKPSDDPMRNGLKPEFLNTSATVTGETKPTPEVPIDPSRFVDSFPFTIRRDDLKRGQERYTIYCALCHDPIGTGNGKIVQRGYLKPPNFHTDDSRDFARYSRKLPLREVPVGYIFDVISNGYGAMPRYGTQIDERDRWLIIAYVRALQLSQHAEVDKLSEGLKKATRDALGATP